MLNQPSHAMQWPSPWGRGYPGWHIECSAMAMKYLGETIDIHSGGTDHIPIHHENEIAQSESATGKPFVRYFVHHAFLVGKEGVKISKSAGKFPLLEDLIAANIDPMAFRLFCFGAKYRSEVVFSDETIRAAQTSLEYLYEFARNSRGQSADQADSSWTGDFEERFRAAINDDLNTPQALAVVLEMIGEAYRRDDKRVWQTLKKFDAVMGLDLESKLALAQTASEFPPEVSRLIEERAKARKERNFALADELRKQIEARGCEVKDSREGSTYVPRH